METPEQPSVPKTSRARAAVTLAAACSNVILLLIVVLLAAALLTRPATTCDAEQNQNTGATPTCVPAEDDSDGLDSEPDTTGESVSIDDLPEVFFTPGGGFDDALRAELLESIGNPMAAWEKEQGNTPLVIEFSENPYEETAATYPYSVALFQLDGYYTGIAIELEADGSVPLWIPECFESICEFFRRVSGGIS